jgi:hypothetical protein
MKYTKFNVAICVILILFSLINARGIIDFDVYTKTKKLMNKMSVLANLHKDIMQEVNIIVEPSIQ